MVLRTAWIHGHSGVLQSSYGFLVEPVGYYLRLKAELPASTWVHYAVPTLLGPQGWLSGIRVRMRTFGELRIESLHVWDGARQVVRHDDLRVRAESGGARTVEDVEPTRFEDVTIGFAPIAIDGAVGVSLFIVAERALDALAVVAVGAAVDDGL